MTDEYTGLNATATAILFADVSGLLPPVAVHDDLACEYDSPCSWAAPGVLANDRSLSGGSLEVLEALDASAGSVEVSANGSVTYTPPK